MASRSGTPARWAWFSPWVIMGSVCILAGILVVLAVKNFHREKEFMTGSLLSQANILMRSVEAGSRTGMKGMGWGQRQLQMLLEETARQPDVLFVAVLDSEGRVVLHSEPGRVGDVMFVSLPSPGLTTHRFNREAESSFEVVKSFQPYGGRHHGGRRWSEAPGAGHWEGYGRDMYIVVALDPSPLESALRQDLHQTLLLFGMMFLVGAAGFVSLTWAQHYRRARSSLQDMRAFTSTVVNQMPVGLLVTDRSGRIEQANEAARMILRCPMGPEGSVDSLPGFVPIARRLQSEERVVEQEIRCRVDEDLHVPLLVNASVIRDGKNRTVGYVFLFSDMTDIKQLEEQLRRSERLAALGRLAAGVAHEIRNPLSSIKGFARILSGRFTSDDRDYRIAETLQEEVERLNKVVTELLDFARPATLHKKDTSIRELVDHSLRLVEGDIVHRNIRTECRIDPEDLRVSLDPDRFAQILLNLYLNALQAMEEGGLLRIEGERRADEAVLRVSDSGRGISPEHIPHVFDPYFTTKPRGVGLGLANVHKLVEAHGGEVEVMSMPGRGTTVTIHLPWASDEV